MRSRGRTYRRSRRSSRDTDSIGPVSAGRRSVPLPRFRREVVALLVAARTGAQRLDSTAALRLVIRWDRMVRLRHSQGKPPCNVVDHILRYERDGAVCPCGNALASPLHPNRDPNGRKARAGCRRCSRHGARGSRRDPGKRSRSTKTIYRKCPCGETAHELSGRRGERELEYTCRNCYRVIVSRPDFLKPLTREEWDRKEARRRG